MSAAQRFSGTPDAREREEFVPFVGELVAASGAVIRRYYLGGVAVESKRDASPVTVADREAEQAMRALIERRYPDHGVLGEEFGAHRPEARYRGVLDPIDGTKAFVSNCYLFGTLISDPRAIGLDLVMPIFFGTMLIPLWRGRGRALAWAVAGTVAFGVQYLFGGWWFIAAGALAGAAAEGWRR